MAYYLQQSGQNLVVSKEIQVLFSTDRFEIVNLGKNTKETRTFPNKINDFVYQPDAKSDIYELRVYLFDTYLPLDRVYFNIDNLSKTKEEIPPQEKRQFVEKKKEVKIKTTKTKVESLKSEFQKKVKEIVENVLE